MRAGKLDRVVTIVRAGEPSLDAGGNPTAGADATLATVRAQLIQQSTQEFLQSSGEASEATVAFRIRWIDGVRVSDAVLYQERRFDILEVKELGRRHGLELRAVDRSAAS